MTNLKILATVLFMITSSFATAQEAGDSKREDLSFAIKAGLNYSNVYDSNDEEFDANEKFGFVGGALLHIPFGKILGVQPEILLSQKGFVGTGTLFGSNYSFTRTTSYIDIPLQLALKPTKYMTILAGPQYSFLLNQKDVFENASGTFGYVQEFENENIRKNILGIVTGLDLNTDNLTIGLRMSWDLQNNNGDGSSDTPRYKNVCFQATIGYTLFN